MSQITFAGVWSFLLPWFLLIHPLCAQQITNIRVGAGAPLRHLQITPNQISNEHLIPTCAYLTIKFDVAPTANSVALVKKGNPPVSLARSANDTLTYEIVGVNIPAVPGDEFVIHWDVNGNTKQASFTVYPIPTIACKTPSPRLGNEVIIEVGPFLRKPERFVILPNDNLGMPAQILKIEKDWSATDPKMQLKCIFERQPIEYKMIVFDRSKPFVILFPQIRPDDNETILHEAKDNTELGLADYNLPSFDPYDRPTFKLLSGDLEFVIAREGDRMEGITLKGTLDNNVSKQFLERIQDQLKKKTYVDLYSSADENTVVAKLHSLQKSLRLEAKLACDRCVVKIQGPGGRVETADVILTIFKLPDVDFTISNTILNPGEMLALDVASTTNQADVLLPAFGDFDKDAPFTYDGVSTYKAKIPATLKFGSYPLYWKTRYSSSKSAMGKEITVKEFSAFENITKFLSLKPKSNSSSALSPEFIDKEMVKDIHVELDPKAIAINAGPQFLRIIVTVTSKDGSILSSKDIKAVTFNPDDPRGKDETSGPYASYLRSLNLNAKPFWTRNSIPLGLDDIPPWAVIKVEVKPDVDYYNIPFDEGNEFRRFYRVKGPWAEVAPSVGAPKVLYPYRFHKDKDINDSLDYGSASVMLKFFLLSDYGKRSWWSIGLGVYGLNASSNKLQGGGFVPIAFSGDILEALRRWGMKVPEVTQLTLDGALFIPFGYPYTRLLLSLTASLTP